MTLTGFRRRVLKALLFSLVDVLLVFLALFLVEVWFKAGVGLNVFGVAWHMVTAWWILPHFLALTFLFLFMLELRRK